jgi:hypothetical protein
MREVEQRFYGIGRRNQFSQACVAAEQHPSAVMINRSVRQIELRSADVATAVIDNEEKSPGEARELGLCAECRVKSRDKWAHVSQATTDAGERGRDDVPDPLVTLRWEIPDLSDCADEIGGHRVR